MSNAVFLQTVIGAASLNFSGEFQTPAGTTKKVGTPSNTTFRSRVVLHDQYSFAPVLQMFSNQADGAWQFVGIRPGKYYAVAFDHTGEYGGEVETDLVAERMP